MKRKFGKKQAGAALLQLLLGGCIGACCAALLLTNLPDLLSLPFGWYLFAFAACFAFLGAALWLHILLHEAGHLLGGLASGYRFVSFRVGKTIWMRRGGAIVRGRYAIAGTGGQCLMAPPGVPDAPFPCVLYNLSGVLANLAAATLLALPCAFLPRGTVRLAFALAALAGVGSGAVNLLPIPGSDGGNLWALRRDPLARRALWVSLAANERLTQDQSAAELPDAWFAFPAPDAQTGPLALAVHLQRADVLLARGDAAGAEALLRALLDGCPRMLPVHRYEARCMLQLLALLLGREPPELSPEEEKYLRAVPDYPAHRCLFYARAVLLRHDAAAAQQELAALEKAGVSYPYPAETALYQSLAQSLAERANAPSAAAQKEDSPETAQARASSGRRSAGGS